MTQRSYSSEDFIMLRGGGRVRIRSAQPLDEPRLRRFFEQLTERTRYLRFFSPMPGVPDRLVRQLAAMDDPTRLTLIAELDQEEASELVGIGNLVTAEDGHAEAALVVADAWQGRGIGTELAERLVAAGEALGVDRFVAHTLWTNPALRALLARTVDVVGAEMHSGVVEITLVPRHRVHEPRIEGTGVVR